MSFCLTSLRHISLTTFKIFPDSTDGIVCHRSVVLYNLHADWETASTAEIAPRTSVDRLRRRSLHNGKTGVYERGVENEAQQARHAPGEGKN